MAFRKLLFRKQQHPCKLAFARRRGSLIVEVVVATALFSTAVFALGRLAQKTGSLSIHADRQLATQLTAENIFARLQAADYDKIAATAKQLESTDDDSLFDIQIQTTAIEIGEAKATQFSVQILHRSTPSPQAKPLMLHDWRIDDSVKRENATNESEDEDE